MLKRLAPIFFAIAFIFALAACSTAGTAADQTSEAPSAPAETEESSESATETPTAQESLDPFGKYDPPIECTYSKVYGQKMLDSLASVGDTVDDNVWTRTIEEELGIKLKLVGSATTSEDYKTQLSLQMSSGALPDFINIGGLDFVLLRQLGESGMAADLTQIVDQYASDAVRQSLSEAGDEILYPATIEGKLIALPQIIGGENQSFCFTWIRRDWIKNLGLAEPKTMDDLIALIKAFTDNDPDQNGKKDTIGILFSSEIPFTFTPFVNSYHAYPQIWVDNGDGKLTYGSVMPGAKNALAKLAELYAGGYLDPEFYTKPLDKAAEKVVSSQCGILYGPQWIGLTYLQNNHLQDKNADWYPYYLLPSDDQPARPNLTPSAGTYYCMNATYEHPEVIVKFLNKHVQKLWDPETATLETNKKWGNDDSGNEWWGLSPVAYEPPGKNFKNNTAVKEAIEKNDQSLLVLPEHFLVYDYVTNWTEDKNDEYWGWNLIYGLDGSNYRMGYYLDDVFMKQRFFTAPTETMSTAWASLETMEAEAYTKIVIGEQSVDSFDTFVQSWKDSGGEACTSEVNAWYDGVK